VHASTSAGWSPRPVHANSDFLASRYSLTRSIPAAPAQRGEVRNDGTISAPGGHGGAGRTDASATPARIVANGGRVGMVAANAVSVDVEGDGLLFFQTSATEAKNRLAQLGRIQADGGTVEMRAAARGAFADTVLNMAGIVQAKTIGTRGGRIVIDGGGEGIVAVSGRIDASGPAQGERGGEVTVQGQKVLIDRSALVDVSGDAGGGTIRVGGDFHGANPEVRNAEETIVMSGSELHADALTRGDGGKVVVWANGATTFNGSITARGGALAGDGGSVETSGKHGLSIGVGQVTASAAAGKPGTWLLDPDNIVVASSGLAATADVATFGVNPGSTQTIAPATLDAAGTTVVLQAVDDITFSNAVSLSTSGAGLTAQAGRSILVNSPITTTNGTISLRAVDPASGAADTAGLLNIAAALNSGTAPVVLQTAGTTGIALGAGITASALTLTTANAPVAQSAGALTVAGITTVNAGTGDITLSRPGNDFQGNVSLTGGALSIADANNLNITTLANAANKSITAIAQGTLGLPAVAINASAGNLDLRSLGGGFTTPGNLTAQDITLVGSTGVNLSKDVTATGNLSLASTNNDIAQSGGGRAAGNGDDYRCRRYRRSDARQEHQPARRSDYLDRHRCGHDRQQRRDATRRHRRYRRRQRRSQPAGHHQQRRRHPDRRRIRRRRHDHRRRHRRRDPRPRRQ
jgi:hypothetical protein